MIAKVVLRFLPISILCALALATLGPARAGGGDAYVISGEDGYGISECMRAGSACGRVIADSWCESHGHAHVLAFGTGADVTGAVQVGHSEAIAPGDVVIRCGE